MTQVLIDRELLEQMRNFTVMHDSGVAGVLRGQIDAILAQPTQQGEVVEVAQVVSYLSACADGYNPDAPHPGPPEPLMTVAQHKRILAASVPAGCKVVPAEFLERVLYLMDNYVTHETPEEEELRALLNGGEA